MIAERRLGCDVTMARRGRLLPMFTAVLLVVCLQRLGEVWQAGELFSYSFVSMNSLAASFALWGNSRVIMCTVLWTNWSDGPLYIFPLYLHPRYSGVTDSQKVVANQGHDKSIGSKTKCTRGHFFKIFTPPNWFIQLWDIILKYRHSTNAFFRNSQKTAYNLTVNTHTNMY